MLHPIYPCLWFDGTSQAAAEFYCSLFKNSNIISNNPIVSIFELDGNRIMGLNGGPKYTINPSISFFVTCSTIEETNALWGKLVEGGKAMMQIDKYPWSERYGWLQDKFGMTWQISVVNSSEDKPQIRPSMLFTGKQFGRGEEAINFYSKVFSNVSTNVLMHYEAGDANAGKLMYSEFNIDKRSMIAMDGPGEHAYTFNEGVSFVVTCENQQEIDHYWNEFTNGGEESMCGWCKDKFGVSWQIVPHNIGNLLSDPVKGGAATQAMLKMRKLDMAVLENA